MHIKLKRVRNELEKYISKGSDEQAVEIYNIVRDYYHQLPVGKQEKDYYDNLEKENSNLKAEIAKLKGDSKRVTAPKKKQTKRGK